MDYKKKIYFTLCFFLIIASLALVLTNIFELNIPRYYPLLHQWSIEKLEGPSTGMYGEVGFPLIFSLILSSIFYLFIPFCQKRKIFREEFFRASAITSLLWATVFSIAIYWHEWGIVETKWETPGFWNLGLLSFLIILLIFLLLFKIVWWLDTKIEKE